MPFMILLLSSVFGVFGVFALKFLFNSSSCNSAISMKRCEKKIRIMTRWMTMTMVLEMVTLTSTTINSRPSVLIYFIFVSHLIHIFWAPCRSTIDFEHFKGERYYTIILFVFLFQVQSHSMAWHGMACLVRVSMALNSCKIISRIL